MLLYSLGATLGSIFITRYLSISKWGACLVGGVIGCQVSNFSTAVWLVHCLQEESSFLCLVREISLQHMTKTMLISLSARFQEPWRKEEVPIIIMHSRRQARSWLRLERIHPSPAFFIDIGALNGKANSNMATLATVTSIVTVAMVIYHISCPASSPHQVW